MDRIKKLKIKKQDGTFSDYIPIGADAENIDTTDGESVQLKLNKKPYYYDNVADMKADNKLKIGDMAITLGYYEANDGGGAEYKIVTNSEKYYEDLENSLKAELIVKKNNNIKIFNDDIQMAIANSEVLYLNNKTYKITLNNQIKKDKITLIGDKNTTIETTSNGLGYIFNFTNANIKNINFIETNINDKTKNTLFTGSNITFENCYFESTVAFSAPGITNIIFKNCVFNDYYRDINNGLGQLNNLQVLNCNFNRIQDYNSPYEGDTRILIYNYEGGSPAITENILNMHGKKIKIENCNFANCNKRQIHIFNVHNVILENNYFNGSGLNSSELGGSDDLVSLDFVDYFKIKNNYFGKSGENELDMLSAHYGEISNNVFDKPYDYYIIDFNYSDYVRTFGENLLNKNLLKSCDINVVNNKIIDSAQFTFNITPSDSIHIYNNDINNSHSNANIILFDDFGSASLENLSGLKITNLDIGRNNVVTYLGNFGKCYTRSGYAQNILNTDSGHLSEDICCYEEKEVAPNDVIYCTNNFPCMNGVAGKRTPTNRYFRKIPNSIVK